MQSWAVSSPIDTFGSLIASGIPGQATPGFAKEQAHHRRQRLADRRRCRGAGTGQQGGSRAVGPEPDGRDRLALAGCGPGRAAARAASQRCSTNWGTSCSMAAASPSSTSRSPTTEAKWRMRLTSSLPKSSSLGRFSRGQQIEHPSWNSRCRVFPALPGKNPRSRFRHVSYRSVTRPRVKLFHLLRKSLIDLRTLYEEQINLHNHECPRQQGCLPRVFHFPPKLPLRPVGGNSYPVFHEEQHYAPVPAMDWPLADR